MNKGSLNPRFLTSFSFVDWKAVAVKKDTGTLGENTKQFLDSGKILPKINVYNLACLKTLQRKINF